MLSLTPHSSHGLILRAGLEFVRQSFLWVPAPSIRYLTCERVASDRVDMGISVQDASRTSRSYSCDLQLAAEAAPPPKHSSSSKMP
ncbi:unnamed protein product [Cyprideis torosa]|uniref:Uncharacterized protein n=1 Tax=Cyprideis torosa TaxID=163714 RepID=A0A7R8ZPE9_9CRUS|nr:unnamed protein product [Cyprideis torosa]CAG0889712.1 unnamed protein product [Cyprideis torosa]